MFLTLRIVHIVMGVFWAGTMFFIVSYLMPSMVAAGPGAGPVSAELAKRKLFQRLPIIAVLTIVTGYWMYGLRMQGLSGPPPRELMVLGVGGIAGLLALIIGFVFVRPNQERSMTLGQEAGSLPAGAEKDAKMAQIAIHRGKAVMGGRIVATLILVTVVTMAIARHV
jgi:hypothetical protein